MRTSFLLAGLALLVPSSALVGVVPESGAVVLEIACGRDNTLFEDADGDTSSGAGTSLYAGTNGQGRTRRALVRFPLEGGVPPGSEVDSVSLILHVASAPDEVARTFTLHRVTRDWGEGVSLGAGGSGAGAASGDATWLHAFYPDTPWSQAGGDFADLPGAVRDVGGVGPWSWEGDGLVADVSAWLADPSSNFGWILLCSDESVPRSVRRFDAREAADPGTRPVLRLVLSPATPTPPDTWGRVKDLYLGGGR